MKKWSESDDLFVNGKLEVFSIDLSSEPLKPIPWEAVDYNGPHTDDFKSFLISRNLQVNCQGKAVVRVRRRGDQGQYIGELFDFYVVETVVPFSRFKWKNKRLPESQAVNKLRSPLDNTRAELAKNNDALNELRSLLEKTQASLAKTYGPLNELQSLTQAELGRKDCGDPFFVAANKKLASIASIFDKRNGLTIDMETNNSPSTLTPAHLIENLDILRGFLKSHLFVDASVIVRDLHLMNEDDLPIIFRDSAADVAELKKKKVGTKSIDNIDANSIFSGYFNIPRVGKFKGVLSRVIDKKLPDEIMQKLRVGEHEPTNDERFWFVNGSGSGIFEDVDFKPSPFLKKPNDFLEFLRRMNGTYVNAEGSYVKFAFTAAKTPTTHYPICRDRKMLADLVRYFDKDIGLYGMFESVQFNANTEAPDVVPKQVYLPIDTPASKDEESPTHVNWIVNGGLDRDVAFTFNEFCFVGKITKAAGAFRNNGRVTAFFEHVKPDQICYVDAQATTSFVLSKKLIKWNNDKKAKAPGFK